MLAAIIANLQNQSAQTSGFTWSLRGTSGRSSQKLPTGDAAGSSVPHDDPHYEIVDILAAIAAFQEIPGEPALARSVRRHRWIGEALPGIKEARDKREAATFLAGAALADAAANERHAAMDRLKIEKLVEIIDAVRAEARPPTARAAPATAALAKRVVPERGTTNSTFGVFALGLVVGSLALGAMLRRPRSRAM